MRNNKICVLGLGYIGFPTAILFANNLFDVYGLKRMKILKNLDSGIIHIDEPNLNEMALHAIKNKNQDMEPLLKKQMFF